MPKLLRNQQPLNVKHLMLKALYNMDMYMSWAGFPPDFWNFNFVKNFLIP